MISINFDVTDEVKEWYIGLIKSYLKDGRRNLEVQESAAEKEFHSLVEEIVHLGIGDTFSEIIVSDFSKIKDIVRKIDQFEIPYDNDKFDKIYHWYDKFIASQINMKIVDKFNIRVCPYCNREFINNRVTGSEAQLDHFFPRKYYKLFAVSLMNFVPSCYVCNHIKGITKIGISPHDSDFKLEDAIQFSYLPKSIFPYTKGTKDLDIEMRFRGEAGILLKQNIEKMQIAESYKLDAGYVGELIRKKVIYNELQINEYIENFGEFTREEINTMIYGDILRYENIANRPLGKLTSDIIKELEE